MEMGAAAIMANTALATAGDLPLMASAFRQAIEAGRKAYISGLGRVLSRARQPLIRLQASCVIENSSERRSNNGKSVFVDSEYLSPEALERSTGLKTIRLSEKKSYGIYAGNGSDRVGYKREVMTQMNGYDYSKYTEDDVRRALEHDVCTVEDFKALLSPAANRSLRGWQREQNVRPAGISEIQCTCSLLFILQITVKTTVSTAASTATIT